jgi:hypothetical protein
MTRVPSEVSEYMKKIGAKGGAASRGASKKRSAAHYRKMVKARLKKRAEK